MSIYEFLAGYGFLLYMWLGVLLMFIGVIMHLFNRLLIRRITLSSIFSAKEWLEKKLRYVSNLEYYRYWVNNNIVNTSSEYFFKAAW